MNGGLFSEDKKGRLPEVEAAFDVRNAAAASPAFFICVGALQRLNEEIF